MKNTHDNVLYTERCVQVLNYLSIWCPKYDKPNDRALNKRRHQYFTRQRRARGYV